MTGFHPSGNELTVTTEQVRSGNNARRTLDRYNDLISFRTESTQRSAL